MSETRSIVVVGATGKTGVHCVRHALESGARCAAVARSASSEKLDDLGDEHADAADRLSLHAGDLTSPERYGKIFDRAGADSVILNVPSMPGADRRWATSVTEAVLEAAKARPGVRKLVMTSGIAPTGLREGERYRTSLRLLLPLARLLLRARFRDMATAFDLVRGQDLPYTIVRADELSDEPGTGNIRVGLAGHMPSKWLTRDDFGLFCVRATAVGFYDREEPTICTLPAEEPGEDEPSEGVDETP